MQYIKNNQTDTPRLKKKPLKLKSYVTITSHGLERAERRSDTPEPRSREHTGAEAGRGTGKDARARVAGAGGAVPGPAARGRGRRGAREGTETAAGKVSQTVLIAHTGCQFQDELRTPAGRAQGRHARTQKSCRTRRGNSRKLLEETGHTSPSVQRQDEWFICGQN